MAYRIDKGRLEEVREMRRTGRKFDLECLHWLGHDFMSDWLEEILMRNNTEKREEKGGRGGGGLMAS